VPGMYGVTPMLLVRRARATLRSAEFGFFGVCVYTRMHTPRFSGHPCSAGDFVFTRTCSRPERTNCENVGTAFPQSCKISFRTPRTDTLARSVVGYVAERSSREPGGTSKKFHPHSRPKRSISVLIPQAPPQLPHTPPHPA